MCPSLWAALQTELSVDELDPAQLSAKMPQPWGGWRTRAAIGLCASSMLKTQALTFLVIPFPCGKCLILLYGHRESQITFPENLDAKWLPLCLGGRRCMKDKEEVVWCTIKDCVFAWGLSHKGLLSSALPNSQKGHRRIDRKIFLPKDDIWLMTDQTSGLYRSLAPGGQSSAVEALPSLPHTGDLSSRVSVTSFRWLSPFFTVRCSDMKTSTFSKKVLGQHVASTHAESWGDLKGHLPPNWGGSPPKAALGVEVSLVDHFPPTALPSLSFPFNSFHSQHIHLIRTTSKSTYCWWGGTVLGAEVGKQMKGEKRGAQPSLLKTVLGCRWFGAI